MRISEKVMMLGSQLLGQDRATFTVWAPKAKKVSLKLSRGGEDDREIPMERGASGIFHAEAAARPGDLYSYVIDDSKPLPDPVSRLLPEGVHGRTAVVNPNDFTWSDQEWKGVPYDQFVIYELHVGTFTPEGTFDGVIARLPYLRDLGITAIEIMPVAAFPGRWNWGYDGVSPYAVFAGYGGPDGLRRLVNAAHAEGLAVILDVVYNHLGAEGNYLGQFGPYFTDRHTTPWGDALNFDDDCSEQVREYFVENALYWIREYHLDGLRLDAVHQIKDESREHIVAEINRRVKQLGSELGRTVVVTAESDQNDPAAVRPASEGGWGLDGVWSDDFHHSLYSLLTGERRGYYQDYGELQQIARALSEGFVFQGEEFKFWGKPRGKDASGMPLQAHIICIENHDQVGNRAYGERLTELTPVEGRRLAAALLCLAPQTPLIFMGQEHDQRSRFQFFTDYTDPNLQQAVRKGRREEFKSFGFEDVPDPQSPETFENSKLNWNFDSSQQSMHDWYRWLLGLRRAFITTAPRRTAVAVKPPQLEVLLGNPERPIRLRCTIPAVLSPMKEALEAGLGFTIFEPWQTSAAPNAQSGNGGEKRAA